MAWIYLLCGGLLEIGFTTCLRYVNGFKNIPWTLAFAACIGLSMICLDHATRVIPLGTTYAIWTGIGTFGTVMIGMLYFGESATPVRIVLIVGLVACIAGLKLTSSQ